MKNASVLQRDAYWAAYEAEVQRIAGLKKGGKAGGDFYVSQAARVSKRFARGGGKHAGRPHVASRRDADAPHLQGGDVPRVGPEPEVHRPDKARFERNLTAKVSDATRSVAT